MFFLSWIWSGHCWFMVFGCLLGQVGLFGPVGTASSIFLLDTGRSSHSQTAKLWPWVGAKKYLIYSDLKKSPAEWTGWNSWFPPMLVGGLVAMFYFPINIGFLIIPIDVHIFQRGSNHQPVFFHQWIPPLVDPCLAQCCANEEASGRAGGWSGRGARCDHLVNTFDCNGYMTIQPERHNIIPSTT